MVRQDEPLLLRLEEYYLTLRSSPDMFVRKVPQKYIRSLGFEPRGKAAHIFEYPPELIYKFIINNLYVRVSLNFQRKLSKHCFSRAFGTIREWFNTATASILPLLLCGSEDITEIDKLVSWAFEHCANNYSHFQRLWKREKKSLRKSFAERRPFKSTCREMTTYTGAFVRHLPANSSDHEMATYVLLWTQTRGTGLADARMIHESIQKFEKTVTIPVTHTPVLERSILTQCCIGSQGVDPKHARVSVGPSSCLENTRKGEGKTGFVSDTLTQRRCLRYLVDFDTLEKKSITPRPLQRPVELLHWGVQQALDSPKFTRAVRVHAVAEPGKARTITVASLAFQAIQGVIAHLLHPTIKSWQVRSGMKASRHLWNFIHEDLNPLNPVWGEIGSGKVYALSTDLETATDYGNPGVARQIYHELVVNAVARGAPRGLLLLGKTLYTSKRFILLPQPGQSTHKLLINTRGWFMGDMMTKVILTIAHDYCCRLSKLRVYSLVGDDEEALSNDVGQLERQIETLKSLDFRISTDDTFISDFFMFYCEEGSLIPTRAAESNLARLRRGDHVLYVDYPRVRLLLPQTLEVDNYSYTNTGRTSLLGKEGKWAFINNAHADSYYKYASLYQHLLLPQDADVSCPYLPIEIGGDGGFPTSPHFLSRVVQDRSRIDVREIAYRMRSLMDDKFHHKFVRSDRLDRVVHKHHLYLPKLEELRRLLPEESLIIPNSDESRILLGSIRLPFIEPGTVTLLRLIRDAYYVELFKGRKPVELKFELDRSFAGAEPGPVLEFTDFSDFIDQWVNPGFKFRDHEPYWVRRDLVLDRDPMHVKLFDVDVQDRSHLNVLRAVYEDWLKANLSIVDSSVEDVLKFLLEKRPLPAIVMDRLNLFMESDNYIMSVFNPTKETVGLVSRDVRLASRMVAKMKRRETARSPLVVLVDPVLYLTGRVDDLTGRSPGNWDREIPADLELIVDPGAIMHVDLTEFEDGFPLREDVFDADVEVVRPRPDNIYICRLQGTKK